MSDANLRELARRAAATGDTTDEQALERARKRAGLCVRCGETPHAPEFTGPACGAPRQIGSWSPLGPAWSVTASVKPLEPHAPGTRCRTCQACFELVAKGKLTAGRSRWSMMAKRVLAAALATSSCRSPAGLALACRRAKPWDPSKPGNGMTWPNQVWTRELARALGLARKQRKNGHADWVGKSQTQLFGGTS